MGPDPAVAAVRLAVRGALRAIEPGDLVLVACSGGADSLALASALAFEAARSGHRAGGVTIDHGLQDGSAEHAAEVAATLTRLGLDPVEVCAVTVGRSGGPEAAAREARYAALDAAAARHGAAAVLLGHTRDDQAETVLLRLARGSGARSLAGMAEVSGIYRRPLLGLDRDLTRRACRAMHLDPWEDPHNSDMAYARVRIRRAVLPALEREVGPGVAAALARTARLLRDDADALDAWAARALADAFVPVRDVTAEWSSGTGGDDRAGGATSAREAPVPRSSGPHGGPAGDDRAGGATPAREAPVEPPSGADARTAEPPERGRAGERPVALDVPALAGLPRAVRTRVLRRAAIAAGSPAGVLAAVHVDALDALIVAWHGQAHVDLPGRVMAWRRCERLHFGPSGSPAANV